MKKNILILVIAFFAMSCEKTNNLVPTTAVNKWGIIGSTSAANGATVMYRTKFIDGTRYTWSVTGGTVKNGQGSYRAEITFTQAGAATVSVEATGKNRGSLSVTVN